jgi:hypothetical protein
MSTGSSVRRRPEFEGIEKTVCPFRRSETQLWAGFALSRDRGLDTSDIPGARCTALTSQQPGPQHRSKQHTRGSLCGYPSRILHAGRVSPFFCCGIHSIINVANPRMNLPLRFAFCWIYHLGWPVTTAIPAPLVRLQESQHVDPNEFVAAAGCRIFDNRV